MKKFLIPGISGICLLASTTGTMVYADDISNSDQYVSKEQYEQLKEEMIQLKEQVKFLLNERSQSIPAQQSIPTPQILTAPQQQVKTEQDIAELQEEVKILKAQNETMEEGTTGFLLTGYAFAGYTNSKSSNSFNAGFNPIFLWRLRDDLIFEAELEFELEDDSTHVALEFAQLSYLLNDYVTIGVGQFLNPSNYFIERLHPAWINKLVDNPLTMNGDNRIQATSQLGTQVRGGIPLGSMRGEYALYLSNGPSMRADGSLNFNDFSNSNSPIAVGGHVGWLPFPGFELGYGFEVAGVNDLNGGTLDVITHSVDFNYLQTSKKYLLGSIDINAQYANRQIGRSSDPTLAFNNQSSGGYAQIAYRPGLSGVPLLINFESVLRYDWVDLPSASYFNDEQRWTIGLNYYLAPSTLLKFAYQFDNKQGAPDDNALFFQIATGF